jgi:DNA-binding transcriptional regulator YiaG
MDELEELLARRRRPEERLSMDELELLDELEKLLARRRSSSLLPSPARCRAIREKASLSQEDLARLLGVSRPALTRWESGQRKPFGDNCVRYLSVLERIEAVT